MAIYSSSTSWLKSWIQHCNYRYAKWKERSKLAHQENGNDSDGEGDNQRGVKRPNTQTAANHPAMKKARNAVPAHKKGPKFEIKRPEEILKKRNAEEKKAANRAKGKGKGKGKGEERKKKKKCILFYFQRNGCLIFNLTEQLKYVTLS